MTMVVIFGPGAVGKMTVGEQLAKITKYTLLQNHVTIEFLLKFFPYESPSFTRLDKLLREELIAELSKSKKNGVIFTFVWALDIDADRKYIDSLASKYTREKDKILFVELTASQPIRLKRNATEKRLSEKPSKRKRDWSDENLKEMDKNYVLNTSVDRPFFLS